MNSRVWLFLHALVAVLPAIGAVAHERDVHLFGSEVPTALPRVWTVDAWRHEQIQPVLQGWFESNVGFRGIMVRTDNSAQTTFVGETKPASVVALGERGTLFLKDDIWYMGMHQSDRLWIIPKIDALTARVGSVQRKLAARGKKLVVVIAPSKTALYAEDVRSHWRRGDGHPGDRADLILYETLRAGLERNAVKFADGHAMFAARRDDERELVYTRTGRHWTTLGACLVLREALAHGPVTPTCAYEMAVADRAEASDFDLYRLLNVWRYEPAAARVPTLTEKPSPEAARPRTVFVGTSYMWQLIDVLRPHVEAPVGFYYNATVYDVSRSPVVSLEPVNPESPHWSDYALDRDLYVVELLETYAHGDHVTGFLEAVERRLD